MNKYLWIVVTVIIIAGYFLITNRNSKENAIPQPIQQESTNSSQVSAPTVCNKKSTTQLTEGPYYKTGSPQKNSLIEEGVVGEPIKITGYVMDQNCQKVVNAWIDFWQADGSGNYDNAGYRLRGHQYTDSEGRYVLETVIPGKYLGRTPHIHVKIRASQNSPILTSQLFMPGELQNQTDAIFNEELNMDVKETENGKLATFDFVLSK